MKKVFWPDNPVCLSSYIGLISWVVWMIFRSYDPRTFHVLAPFLIFMILIVTAVYYCQRLVFDDKFVTGPIQGGLGWRKLRRDNIEAFFDEKIMGFRFFEIREKGSAKSIKIPFLTFRDKTRTEIKSLIENEI
jgi:hypothetical protein